MPTPAAKNAGFLPATRRIARLEGDALWAGICVATTKSASDGYYIVPSVATGMYYLRICKEQLKELKPADTGMHLIMMKPEVTFINGADFLLQPR